MEPLSGRTPRDQNRVPALFAIDTTNGTTTVPLEANPVTGALLVETVGGGGASVSITSPLGSTTAAASVSTVLSNDYASTGKFKLVDSGGTNIAGVDASGNVGVNINENTIGLATSANQTNGTQQTKITDGTNIANVVAGDTGFNGVATTSGTKTITFTTSTPGAQILGPYNIEGYQVIDIQYTSVGSGLTLTGGQFCNTSGGTYIPSASFTNNANSNGQAVGPLGVTVNNIYRSPVNGNFFQINISALASGTVSGFIVLRAIPIPLESIHAQQQGTWTVGSNSATGSAVPANAFYIAGINGSGNLTGISTNNPNGDAQSPQSQSVASTAYPYVYNGTNWDRQRTANTASNTTGTGLLGAGNLGYDGTNWQSIGVTAANSTTTGTSGTSQLVSGTGFTTATLTLNSGTPNTSWYDMLNYAWVSVEILTNTTPATLTFQTSGDSSQTNINTMPLQIANGSSNNPPVATTTSAVATFHGPRTGRWFRISSNNGAGTTTLVITFHTVPSSNYVPTNQINSASATGSTVPGNAFYMGIRTTSSNLIGMADVSQLADATTNQALSTGEFIYNGTNWDRVRNNTTGAVIAAGATTTQTSSTITTYNANKLVVIINISAFTSGTLTFTVNALTSSSYTYPLLVSTALGATGTTPLRIFPGATASANAVANDVVPRQFNVVVTGTFSATYGVDYTLGD